MRLTRLIFAILLISVCLSGYVYATEEAQDLYPEADYPAWSPDGQHIGFQRDVADNMDIWLIHPDGTGLQQVTTQSGLDRDPQWGPDSDTIYFTSDKSGKTRLWKKVLSTGAETQVLDKSFIEYTISHSGEQLIIEDERDDSVGLILIPVATGEEIRWLAIGRHGDPANLQAWSPDDHEVVFHKKGNFWAKKVADLSNLRQLTTFTEEDRTLGRPNWGPSGYIVFQSNFKIYKVRPNGTGLTCIFEDAESYAENPSWSPTGKLVFARRTADSKELWTMNGDGTGLTQLTHTVATPEFSPDSGSCGASQNITISCSTSGAAIHYTIDGTDPTESSTLYTSQFTIQGDVTVKAKGWKTDYFPSEVKTGIYTSGVVKPAFDPDGGTYTGTQYVMMTCDTPSATIRYTTDGTDPTESSPLYDNELEISSNTTVKAKAFKDGCPASDVKSAQYVIQ